MGVEEEEAKGAKLAGEKRALEQAKAELESQLKTSQGGAADLTKEKNALDLKCRNLGADLEQRDASIATLTKEKKHLEGVNAQTLDELAAAEDKGNHLNKL